MLVFVCLVIWLSGWFVWLYFCLIVLLLIPDIVRADRIYVEVGSVNVGRHVRYQRPTSPVGFQVAKTTGCEGREVSGVEVVGFSGPFLWN